MDRWLDVLVWTVGFAILFGIVGFFHGGLARYFARRWHRAPEPSADQAFFAGARRGGVFGAILGLCVGGLAVYLQSDDPAGEGVTVAFLWLLGKVALIALVLGGVAYGLEWLGVSKGRNRLPRPTRRPRTRRCIGNAP